MKNDKRRAVQRLPGVYNRLEIRKSGYIFLYIKTNE